MINMAFPDKQEERYNWLLQNIKERPELIISCDIIEASGNTREQQHAPCYPH